MAADTLFRQKAPKIMGDLTADFSFQTVEDSAAIVGNLGHESGGFRFLQEKKPMIPGTRGGWGWAQWTGPRRVKFESYVARNSLDPAGDKANYGFLFVELTTTEAAAIPAVKKAPTLYDKVVAFEIKFERAGVKHYPSRLAWAKIALAAGADAAKAAATKARNKAAGTAAGGAAIGTGGPAAAEWDWAAIIACGTIGAMLVAGALLFVIQWRRNRKVANQLESVILREGGMPHPSELLDGSTVPVALAKEG